MPSDVEAKSDETRPAAGQGEDYSWIDLSLEIQNGNLDAEVGQDLAKVLPHISSGGLWTTIGRPILSGVRQASIVLKRILTTFGPPVIMPWLAGTDLVHNAVAETST